MVNFFKNTKFIFKSVIKSSYIEVALTVKNKVVPLESISEDPNLGNSYSEILRLVDAVSGLSLKGFNESCPNFFSEEDLSRKLCIIEKGVIKISLPLMYAITFESFFLENFGLHKENFEIFNLPKYNFLIIKLAFSGKLDSKNFQIKKTLLNEFNREVNIATIGNSTLQSALGESYFITPEQRILINYVEEFNKNANTNINKRVRALAEIKKLSVSCSVSLSGSIDNRSYLSVDELKVSLGRNMEGTMVLEPNISPDNKINEQFRREYAQEVNFDTSRVFTDSKGKDVRISFSETVIEDKKKIDEYKHADEKTQQSILSSPEEHFRKSQLEGFKIEEVLSERITGFIFGKPDAANWSIEKNSNAWNMGYEGESLFLQSKDGVLTQVDVNNIPDFYTEIVRKIDQVKNDIDDEELSRRLEDNDFLTPLPMPNAKVINLESISGDYTLDALSQCANRIELEHLPELDTDDIDLADTILVDTSNADLVLWDSNLIPHNSLKRAVNKIKKKQQQNEKAKAVSFSLTAMEGESEINEFSYDIDKKRPPYLKEKFSLKEHQTIGYSWLKSIFHFNFKDKRRGALLADDMGLGKTLQVISLINYVKSIKKYAKKPMLIVAPLSLIDGSWIEEGFEFFFDKKHISKNSNSIFKIINLKDIKLDYKKAQIYKEARDLQERMVSEKLEFSALTLSEELSNHLDHFKGVVGSSVLVTSYETMRSKIFEVSSLNFSLAVLDEAQKIKSGNSLQNRAARSLKADMNIAITGTPIENGMMDLWNIMDFVYPKKLGSRKKFKSEFISEISNAKSGTVDREQLKKKLENKLKPFWLRRIKSDVLVGKDVLPPITYYDSIKEGDVLKNIHAVRMSDVQMNLYRQKMSIFNSAGKGEKLAVIRQLIEVCNSPWIPLDEKISFDNLKNLFKMCPKLKVTFDILDNIFNSTDKKGRKVIIFANIIQVQSSLAYIIKEWAKYKYNYKLEIEVYNERIKNAEKRKEILKNIEQAEGFKVLVISPKAGGAGLNIQCANHVIHYTREWNPALESQATARCYRIGQKRPVSVYFPISIGTLEVPTAEENLSNILRSKRNLMEDFTISSTDCMISPSEFITETSYNEDSRVTDSDLRAIGSKQFERLISKIFEKDGFRSEVVGGAGDRGADVLCFSDDQNYIIQVKQRQSSNKKLHTTGISEIRGAVTHYEHKHNVKFKPLVVTNGEFSSNAYQASYQGGNDVGLKGGDWVTKKLSEHNIKHSEIKTK